MRRSFSAETSDEVFICDSWRLRNWGLKILPQLKILMWEILSLQIWCECWKFSAEEIQFAEECESWVSHVSVLSNQTSSVLKEFSQLKKCVLSKSSAEERNLILLSNEFCWTLTKRPLSWRDLAEECFASAEIKDVHVIKRWLFTWMIISHHVNFTLLF